MYRFTDGLTVLVIAATFGMLACTKPQPISSVRTDKPVYRPGETIVVSFTASPDYDPKAWVGIVPSKIPHGSEQANTDASVAFQSLNKRENGTLTFTAPDTVGQWDARMMTSESNAGAEVAHATFKVEGKPIPKPATPTAAVDPKPAPTPAPAPTIIVVNEQQPAPQPVAQPAPQPVAPTPAAPPPVPSGAPTINISGSEYPAGADISVTFTALSSFASDAWIGIVPSSTPHGSRATGDPNGFGSQYLNKKTSGTMTFQAPNDPGEYDLRMYNSDANGKEVGSVSFTVK